MQAYPSSMGIRAACSTALGALGEKLSRQQSSATRSYAPTGSLGHIFTPHRHSGVVTDTLKWTDSSLDDHNIFSRAEHMHGGAGSPHRALQPLACACASLPSCLNMPVTLLRLNTRLPATARLSELLERPAGAAALRSARSRRASSKWRPQWRPGARRRPG